MPKIIDDARDRILTTAREQLLTTGYRAMSLRSLAGACGLAVGTIYNYFESKDTLVAYVVMEDWHQSLAEMQNTVVSAQTVGEGMGAFLEEIRKFEQRYLGVFRQFSQNGRTVEQDRHIRLRQQLEQLIRELTERLGKDDELLLPVLAELLMTCALQEDIGKEYIVHMADCLYK